MAHPQSPDPSQRLGKGMIAAAWILALVVLTVIFNGYLAEQRNPNRHPETGTDANGAPEVILKANRDGHYVATGRINGQSVEFLLDTGASDVSVPGRVARRLGLRAGAPARYSTANGSIVAYQTVIHTLSLGNIVVHDVSASINPHASGDSVLLGMTVLRRVDFSQRGDRLILREPNS
ncbi:MAG: TIGR02281 family clan AA aspartic protease [Gammaproteobacteria bacterium]|jgi:aspartyl protease family protein